MKTEVPLYLPFFSEHGLKITSNMFFFEFNLTYINPVWCLNLYGLLTSGGFLFFFPNHFCDCGSVKPGCTDTGVPPFAPWWCHGQVHEQLEEKMALLREEVSCYFLHTYTAKIHTHTWFAYVALYILHYIFVYPWYIYIFIYIYIYISYILQCTLSVPPRTPKHRFKMFAGLLQIVIAMWN